MANIIGAILFISFAWVLLMLIAMLLDDRPKPSDKTAAGDNVAKMYPLPEAPNSIENMAAPLQPETNPPYTGHARKVVKLRLLAALLLISVGIFLQITLNHNYLISSIPEQIQNLGSEKKAAAIEMLLGMEEHAVGPLVTAFHDTKGEYLQAGIVETLRQIRDKRAVEPLMAALNDEAPAVRAAVVEALGWIEDKRAVEPLIVLLNDEAPTVRAAAVEALAKIGDESAIEPFIAVLNDHDPAVRAAAARALGVIGDERAVEPLIAVLNDEAQTVRVDAARTLVSIGDERAVVPLMDALERRDLAVIANASAFFIKRGKAGDEPVFIEALYAYGNTATANNYLNCGNNELEDAARAWAEANGYEIRESNLRDGVYWGSE